MRGDFELSNHARDRMAERGINRADVAAALRNYVLRMNDPTEPGRWEYQGPSVTGRTLTMWVPAGDTPDTWPKFIISLVWES